MDILDDMGVSKLSAKVLQHTSTVKWFWKFSFANTSYILY